MISLDLVHTRALVALAMGKPPLMGVLAGSVTLTGGPATGLAFLNFWR